MRKRQTYHWEKVAAQLGVPFYDKKLLEIVAQRSGLSVKTIEQHGEYIIADKESCAALQARNGQSVGDGEDYNLCLDSSKFGIDACAEIITSLCRI